jgi:hypothetical protein
MRMKFPLVQSIGVVWLALAAGCSSTPISPTFPAYATVTRFFSGSLAPGAASTVFTFSAKLDGAARVTLGSVTSSATGEPDPTMLTLSLGTPSGGTCSPTNTKTEAAALSGQVTAVLKTGDYCITLADPGTLTQAVDFTIRVVTSVGITPGIGAARFDPLPGTLARNSQSLKTFTVGSIGTLKVFLTSAAADPTLPIKIGLGLWDGSACRLNTTIVSGTSADALITTTADAGDYCVVLTDIGNLPSQTIIIGSVQHQ